MSEPALVKFIEMADEIVELLRQRKITKAEAKKRLEKLRRMFKETMG